MILRMLTAISLVLLPVVSAQAQEAQCVAVAGQNLSPSDIYDPGHLCSTCAGQRAHAGLCGTINHVMVPNWRASSDLISIPHRGYWGQPLSRGASENTLNALQEAVDHGYKVIEIDVSFTGPRDNPETVYLGHYFSMAAADGGPGLNPNDIGRYVLMNYFTNFRDQTPATLQGGNELLMLEDALNFAKENDVLLMIDPKEMKPSPGPDYLARIIAKTIQIAQQNNALQNISIKTTYSYRDLKSYLSNFYPDLTTYDGKFLWNPITTDDINSKTLRDVLMFLDDWNNNTNNSKRVATYETNIFSPDYFGGKPFSWSNSHYLNLIDYVRQMGTTSIGKRSALWSLDPMGNKGTLDRMYKWKFIGNTSDDKRGNVITTLSYDWARHTAVNTDRADVYRSIVKQ